MDINIDKQLWVQQPPSLLITNFQAAYLGLLTANLDLAFSRVFDSLPLNSSFIWHELVSMQLETAEDLPHLVHLPNVVTSHLQKLVNVSSFKLKCSPTAGHGSIISVPQFVHMLGLQLVIGLQVKRWFMH